MNGVWEFSNCELVIFELVSRNCGDFNGHREKLIWRWIDGLMMNLSRYFIELFEVWKYTFSFKKNFFIRIIKL